MQLELVTAQLSKRGGRKENQDYCACLNRGGYGCYTVADGLGGHRGGALAARTAGESVIHAFAASPGASPAKLQQYLEQAREAMQGSAARAGSAGVPLKLKTTLVVLVSDFHSAFWAHVGDSRLYFFRAGKLHFQTSDHSVPQLLLKSGVITRDQIRTHEDRNRLTASFDGEDLKRIVYAAAPVELETGDAFLLCSDGFWEYVDEPEMEIDLAPASHPQAWLDAMERKLLARAAANHDNYTALAVMSRGSR